jgi:hypothetical protein
MAYYALCCELEREFSAQIEGHKLTAKEAAESAVLRAHASTAVKQGEHWHKIADKLRSALLRTTGSLGLIIKGAGAHGPGHKENYDHASKVLDETC